MILPGSLYCRLCQNICLFFLEYGLKIFVHIKLCFKFARSNEVMAYGVIGNTAGFGPVVLGSSPSRPT